MNTRKFKIDKITYSELYSRTTNDVSKTQAFIVSLMYSRKCLVPRMEP